MSTWALYSFLFWLNSFSLGRANLVSMTGTFRASGIALFLFHRETYSGIGEAGGENKHQVGNKLFAQSKMEHCL